MRHSFFKNTASQVIPNPVSFPEMKPHTPGTGSLRLLYVGQLNEEKGARGLVDTVAGLTESSVSLTMIGDGSDSQYICDQAEVSNGRIKYLGRVPHASVPNYFAEADILVAPTLCYDNFPTIVAEALRCSLPVIISDIGGAKEIVQDTVNGWIVEAGNWEQLASLIQKLAADPSLILEAATRSSGSVFSLTVDRYIDQLLTALHK